LARYVLIPKRFDLIVMDTRLIRIAILFPSTGLIDGELCDMAEERGAQALIYKVSPLAIADPASPSAVAAMVQEMGSPAMLAHVARQTLDVAPDVVVWACTSGSFLGGDADKAAQAGAMSAAAGGIPATTTSLAILDTLLSRNIRHVAAVTPYHVDIGRKFVSFLADNGFIVDGEAHAGCGSDSEVGALTISDLKPLVARAVTEKTEAVVIPCTALRHQTIEADLLKAFGIPAVLANAATLDYAIKLARMG